jgi:hypothetical protein
MGLSPWSHTGLSRCFALVDCLPALTPVVQKSRFRGDCPHTTFHLFSASTSGGYFHLYLCNLTVVIFVEFVTVGSVASPHCVTAFSTVMGAHSISLTQWGCPPRYAHLGCPCLATEFVLSLSSVVGFVGRTPVAFPGCFCRDVATGFRFLLSYTLFLPVVGLSAGIWGVFQLYVSVCFGKALLQA